MTIRQRLFDASAQYNGQLIIRASTAMDIIGLPRATYCNWANQRQLRRVRITCTRSRKAPTGEIVALWLDDLLDCWDAHKSRRKWQRHEVDLLEDYYGSRTNQWIAKQIGRSARSVQSKANQLGLHMRTAQGYICASELARLLRVSVGRVREWFSRRKNPLKRVRTASRRWLLVRLPVLLAWLIDNPRILANLDPKRVAVLRNMAGAKYQQGKANWEQKV
ncbi:MAG: hypothetical protein AAGC72_11145 [Planctomycetota bacterium]